MHKPIISKFKKRKVYSFIRDKIWGADLSDMQLVSKYNKEVRFLLRAIDIYSKYTSFVLLKDKNDITIATTF